VDKRPGENPKEFPFSTENEKKQRLVVIRSAPSSEITEVLDDTF